MSDGYYDAPAYCALCDRPISIGPLCGPCEDYDPYEAEANEELMDGDGL